MLSCPRADCSSIQSHESNYYEIQEALNQPATSILRRGERVAMVSQSLRIGRGTNVLCERESSCT